MIPLTKTLDPDDYKRAEILAVMPTVDKFFQSDQHPHRRWEYAMALRAIWSWKQHLGELDEFKRIADVGGVGSPFHLMVVEAGNRSTLIDPKENTSVEEWAAQHNSSNRFDAVISISTFEHTEQPLAFLEACCRILKPGGLLFLTFDYLAGEENQEALQVQDTAHFHWMRERLLNRGQIRTLFQLLCGFYNFEEFGGRDLTDRGPHVYDYSFASLCLRKAA